MTDRKDTELSPEEIQFNHEIEDATMSYGELEDEIRNMKPDKPPQPVPRPSGAPTFREIPTHIKVLQIRQRQDAIKESVKQKASEITKDSTPEIREKISLQSKEWADSDIHKKYLELKEKTEIKFKENNSDIQQGKNVETPKAEVKSQIDQERPKENGAKNIEQDAIPQNQGLSSYDPTSKFAGSKFMDNKDDILTEHQPDISEIDIDSKESSEPEPTPPGKDD